MGNICSNCKYFLEKETIIEIKHLCTHPDATQVDMITGREFYQECYEFRKSHDLKSKYQDYNDCSRFVQKTNDDNISFKIFIGSLFILFVIIIILITIYT